MSNKIISGIVKDIKGIPAKIIGKGKADPKKLILMFLPYVLAGYFADKISYVYRMSPGTDVSSKMTSFMAGLDKMFVNPMPSFAIADVFIGFAGGVGLRLIVYFKAKNAKKFEASSVCVRNI